MRILYVKRAATRKHQSIKKYFQNLLFGYPLSGQDGFFEASLWTAFPDLHAVDYEELCKMIPSIDKTYDWIILNSKFFPKGKPVGLQELSWLKTLNKCGKAILDSSANADILPDERLLDYFDVIFKRELLKDLDRYKISPATHRKLHVTMLSCPLVRAHLSRFNHAVTRRDPVLSGGREYIHDVSFIGTDNNPIRRSVLAGLSQFSNGFYGGLYDRYTGKAIEWDGPRHPRLRRSQYIQVTVQSRINLALDGKGQFTFRHLDLWCLGAFMLSTSSIREIQLPGTAPEENVHYVSFKDKDELKEKVQYYLANEQERQKIAEAGKDLFKSIYDFSRHGQYIKDVLLRFKA